MVNPGIFFNCLYVYHTHESMQNIRSLTFLKSYLLSFCQLKGVFASVLSSYECGLNPACLVLDVEFEFV